MEQMNHTAAELAALEELTPMQSPIEWICLNEAALEG